MTTTQIFKNSTGLHIEGNLIAGDYLADLVTGSIKGQAPEDFGFAKADKLADEIATVWGEAKKFWAGFKKSREESSFSESGTTETRKAWVVPLLYNLGYLPSFRGEVEVIDGQSFAISHRAGMPSPPSPLSQKGRGGERESEILSPSPRGRGARGEGEPPIHITGCRIRLDHKPPSGNPRLSAHGLMQEYLNRTEHLWGITTNGLQWRLLRDSSLMTRLTYIEFDLEQILEGENFADFGLFYRLFHRSRLPIGMDDAHECLLEFYHQETLQQGGRVRDRLRDGVERAIAQLGNGFLQHPKNQVLRDKFAAKEISDRDFYRQILLLIYRLLFLMVAESRNLLLTGEDPEKVRIYEEYYSIERLRALAEKAIVPRREGFQDLWQGLRVTFCLFDENWRGELLGLSPLNGDLFGSTTLPELNVSALDNYDLMVVIRNLSLYAPTDKTQLRRVNYAALDVEELGSVYESLLDFHPQVSLSQGKYEFLLVAGSDRKTTGAYYTPSELVAQLVKSALEPVIAERMNEAKNSLTPQPPLPRGEGEQDEFQNPSPSGRGAGVRDSWEISDDLRKKMQDVARQFRKEPTQSEAILWEAIRNRKLENRKFRRQHPIGTFIVDFFCREENLIVEVDGLIHESQQELDRQRQGLLESLGLHFVRVSSQQVETSLFETLETIKQSFLLPSPSGRGAGGEGLQQLQESALLSIKVCDPACGSGHFLLAAARRIGKELAKVRTGEAAPSPEPLREATRDVIQHCIYGVDINPLAVDLCKVALWIEGFAKGMPLNFLDHRIKCGNSLVGVLNLDVLKEGIPDEAFKAVTGDDKALSSIKKKANKQERLKDLKGQLSTAGQLDDDLAEIASAWQELDRIPENTPEFVKQKKERYEANQRDRKWWRSRSACNLWTAAFFMPLTEQNLQLLPTTAALVRLLNEEIPSPPSPLSQKGRGGTGTEENLAPLSPLGRGAGGEGLPAIGIRDIVDAANQLASEKGFFHWALEFPDVFENDGFDCILGNPPWERIKLQEKEFFALRDGEIAKAANKSEREKLIKALPTQKPELAREFEAAKHDAEAQSKFIRESNRFPLTAVGDVNTYAVFSETARDLIAGNGRAGIIVPTGIATDDTTKKFFSDLVQKQSLDSLIGFENEAFIFSEVHNAFKFCALVITGKARIINATDFIFLCRYFFDIKEQRRHFTLTSKDIALINPNTLTCPIFRTVVDAKIIKKIYQNIPVLENEKTGENPWDISFMSMFHMANDSELFHNSPSQNTVLLYEAKMFWHYDHRFSTYENAKQADINSGRLPQTIPEMKQDSNFDIKSRYWINRAEVENRLANKWNKQWLIGFRDITTATNERTAIFSLLPRVAVGHKAPLLLTNEKVQLVLCLFSNFNSLVFDFVARQKVGGTSFSFFIFKQLPVLPPDRYSQNDINYITPLVLELTYTAWDIKPFADDIWNPTPTRSQSEIEGSKTETHSILTQVSDKQQLGLDLELDLTGKKQLELTTPPDPTHQTHLRQLILEQWQANRAAFDQDPHPPTPSPKEGEGEQDSFRTPLPTWERGRGEGLTDNLEGIPLPPFIWHETRRAQIRAELDAYYAKLYGLTRDELRYILDPADIYGADFPSETFRVLKNNEMKKYGEYRTQRLVLEAWDKLGY
ncbi:endonuclease domain-containing protein [Phormidium tenue]|uniref:endonuclease domain-containing protein n=1 Tax=Phormidium tenue TaxID=126344 RepID=UPI001F559F7D|nr:DUF559 domain-containing protein [Phormidium tenue]